MTIADIRTRIDRVASKQQRKNILSELGCYEIQEGERSYERIAENPRTKDGRALVRAIADFDLACAYGVGINIQGELLIELWHRLKKQKLNG